MEAGHIKIWDTVTARSEYIPRRLEPPRNFPAHAQTVRGRPPGLTLQLARELPGPHTQDVSEQAGARRACTGQQDHACIRACLPCTDVPGTAWKRTMTLPILIPTSSPSGQDRRLNTAGVCNQIDHGSTAYEQRPGQEKGNQKKAHKDTQGKARGEKGQEGNTRFLNQETATASRESLLTIAAAVGIAAPRGHRFQRCVPCRRKTECGSGDEHSSSV